MPGVRLKGLNRVAVKLADGRRVVYWYAWKGGPRLPGAPGSGEFVAAFAAAHAARKQPKQGTLAGLVAHYRTSPEFARLAKSTQAEWRRWLSRIELATIASLPLAALEDREVRVELLAWRDTYADRPRTADYATQVLSRVLAWSKGRGLISANHFEGVEHLHQADRADQVWASEELAAFEKAAAPEVTRALKLACYTGLRRGDLVGLRWEYVGETAIVFKTSKTGREVTVPLIAEAIQVLGEIGRKERGPVLLNTRGKPWSTDGLENRIIKAKTKAGVDKRLHDARGTFATRLRLAGLNRDEIATVMGWEPARVERILARYVDQARFLRSIADKLAAAGANES
jgi:integrase